MLEKSVTELTGVGEKTREQLEALGIRTIRDLLYYFPSRYNVHEIKPLRELNHDETVTVVGKVLFEPTVTYHGRGRSRLIVMVDVENVTIKAVMFNRAFLKDKLSTDDQIILTGKWDAHRLQIIVNHIKINDKSFKADIQPIYSLKGDLKMSRLRGLIRQALTSFTSELEEFLPNNYLISYKLPLIKDALWTIHLPKSKTALKHAKRRFIYEELLLFQLQILHLQKEKREATIGNSQHFNPSLVQQFVEDLPYELTRAQERSVNEILSDLKSPYQMNRLLQGDVGSGKTAVAAINLYASITAGKQTALMVPTEILAEQHTKSLEEMFSGRIKIALLTGSVKGKKREQILKGIENHEIDLVVGTHALIQEDVVFNDLGFIVIDEQHRFGVEQRKTLREKGLTPDVLFMTATPIPRTLAITAFGDMDVSIIDELPAGRKEVETYWTTEQTFPRVLNFIMKHVNKGEQAYVISPLIEESDVLDIQNAVELHEKLRDFFPEDIEVGLMHGRLKNEEKEQVMKDFANNNIQVLVSTTVVEVGVNVPNATIMVIYDAERFGLSQLHQLRGRVGRGDKQSYCILIADPKGEVGKERMKIMTETTDGFKLAEEDLKLRGPGDFFGKKQSGLPEFTIADLIRDYRALEVARQDAREIIERNLLETSPEYFQLKRYFEAIYSRDEILS